MNLKRRKQPISDEGGVHLFSSTQALHPDSRNSEERSRPVRPRFACPSRQVISLKCLRLAQNGPSKFCGEGLMLRAERTWRGRYLSESNGPLSWERPGSRSTASLRAKHGRK